jgi:hypothetical protein
VELLEIKKELSEKNHIKDFAVILDKNNNLHLVSISVLPGVLISLKSFNENKEETGYINLYFHENKRIYLDTVYCYDKYRGLNIASKLSKIIDYVLQDYQGYIIRGEFHPSQLSSDRENKIFCSQEELTDRANNFYSSSGYSKIYYDDYVNNPELYPDINVRDDFQLGEELAECIVVKKVIKNDIDYFKRIKGILIDKEILEASNNNLIETIEKRDKLQLVIRIAKF